MEEEKKYFFQKEREREREYLLKWKESVENFLFQAEKVAKPIVEYLFSSSQPASVTGEDLERLRLRIHRIRVVLADADRVESKSACLKLWLREIRDLEYEAEEIVEDFELQAQRFKLQQPKTELLDRSALGKRKREVLPQLSSRPFLDLSLKIKKIRERYQEIASDRDVLWLRDEDGEKRLLPDQRQQSSSFIPTNIFFSGRDTELKELIARVVSDAGVEPVIAIVGMAGVGKTALAQHVFNNLEVVSLFEERRWWVSMSTASNDAASVTRSIIDAVTKGNTWEARSCTQLDALQRVLTTELQVRGRNCFLLVLDDARFESQGFWDTLCRPFKGAKLLVTTQSSEIAKMLLVNCEAPKGFKLLHLSPLADTDCFSIVDSQQTATCVHPKSMRKMITWCGGLPLAAKTLRDLILRRGCRDGAAHCEDPLLCSSSLWTDLINEILPILRLSLSYDDLSLCSKRCFEYLSLFPRGHELDKEQLARLWMAQELEQRDTRCFKELVRKFLLLHNSDTGKCQVHHLFHELARSESAGDCTMSAEDSAMSPRYIYPVRRRTRHLSLTSRSLEQEIQLTCADGGRDELAKLRTLLIFRSHEDHKLSFFHARFSATNLQFLPYLRSLDLSHTNIEELPILIGNLSHLRYLGLRSTRIRELPDSICLLYKLQTLDLKDCLLLKELPWGTRYLSDLQHLELSPSPHLLMPCGIGALTRLQTLSTFVIGNYDHLCRLEELKELVDLRGELYISGLNYVRGRRDACNADLRSKKLLDKLTLEWYHQDSCSSKPARLVFNELQPCTTLKSLVIRGYNGTRLSSWMGDQRFMRLVSVTIEGCAHCTKLPCLDQLPALKHLSVALMGRLRCVGSELCGSHGFHVLETLEFKEMPLWEEWCGNGDFPALKSITLTECPKLKNLPEFKPATKLSINHCQLLIPFSHCGTVC